jgi:voltage-gated potassium channel
MKALRKLRTVGLLLIFIVAAGTLGFYWIEGWQWFDALYMVIITVTTVGYMEVHPLSHAGRIFNLFVMCGGITMLLFAVGMITQTLLEFELDKVFGRRRMERELDRIKDHFIICGAGRVGHAAARELAQKPVPFVIIERTRDPKNDEGWLLIEGDATQEKVLREAHIERAVGLVAATTTDATNIYIVLTARGLNPKLKIIARSSEEGAEKHLKTAGADIVISPYSFAGHRIAQSFLRPNVVDFLDIAISREMHEEMVIEEILVGGESKLAGATVGGSGIHRELGIMVLAIKRSDGRPCFNPTANEVIHSGDNLIVMGEAQKMPRLEAIAASGVTK